MSLTTILLLAIGIPVVAFLVATGAERALRKADEFDWRFVDRRLLWTFIVLDQAFVAALDWNKRGPWFWFTVLCMFLSATVLVKEIAKRWRVAPDA